MDNRETKARVCQEIACIFFVDPDEEFKRIMKHARRKLEIPMPAAMFCSRLQHHKHRETCCTVGEHKTKYDCIVQAGESLRIRMVRSENKNHEDLIAGRGMNSLSHYNLVCKIYSCASSHEIPDAKAAVEKQWENERKYGHGS